MNADISCQHTCVSEGVFASVSGCEEIQHGLSSHHTSCSTCPSTPQQTEGQNLENSCLQGNNFEELCFPIAQSALQL